MLHFSAPRYDQAGVARSGRKCTNIVLQPFMSVLLSWCQPLLHVIRAIMYQFDWQNCFHLCSTRRRPRQYQFDFHICLTIVPQLFRRKLLTIWLSCSTRS